MEEEILVYKNNVITDKSRRSDHVCKIILGTYTTTNFMEKNDEILFSLIVFTVKILNPAPKMLVPIVNISSTYE